MTDPELPNILRRRLLFLHVGLTVAACVGVASSWALLVIPTFSSAMVLMYGVAACIRFYNTTFVLERCCCCVNDNAKFARSVSLYIGSWSTVWAVVGVVVASVMTDLSPAFRVFAVLASLAHCGMSGCAWAVHVLLVRHDVAPPGGEPVEEVPQRGEASPTADRSADRGQGRPSPSQIAPQGIASHPTLPLPQFIEDTEPTATTVTPSGPRNTGGTSSSREPTRHARPALSQPMTSPAAPTVATVGTNTFHVADTGTQCDLDGAADVPPPRVRPPQRFKIYCRRLTNDVRALEVSPADTVAGLAARIAALEGHSAASFHLAANGSIMADPERTLASHNLKKDTSVAMLFRMAKHPSV